MLINSLVSTPVPVPSLAPAAPPEPPPAAAPAHSQAAVAQPGPTPAVAAPDHAASSPGDQYDNPDQDRSRRQQEAVREFELSAGEQAMLNLLQQRDRQVRAHESAHKEAGGPHVAGGVSYTYQTGPDGRQYAVGGEVPIDASRVPDDPEATIDKARTVRRAALAPADPSAADRAVAARASQMESRARGEISRLDKVV